MTPRHPAEGATGLADLAARAEGCTACGLSATRTRVVFGAGRADAGWTSCPSGAGNAGRTSGAGARWAGSASGAGRASWCNLILP